MNILTPVKLYEAIEAICKSEEKLNRSEFKDLIDYSTDENALTKYLIGCSLGSMILAEDTNELFNKILTLMAHGSTVREILQWYNIERNTSLVAMAYFNELQSQDLPSIQFCKIIHKRTLIDNEALPIDFSTAKVKSHAGSFTIREILDYSAPIPLDLLEIRTILNGILWLKGEYEAADAKDPKDTETMDFAANSAIDLYYKLERLNISIYSSIKDMNYTSMKDWYDSWLVENALPGRGEIVQSFEDKIAIKYLNICTSGITHNLNGVEYLLFRKLIYVPAPKPRKPVVGGISTDIEDKYPGDKSGLDTAQGLPGLFVPEEYIEAIKNNPNYQLYPRKYYSGSDAQIFFNNKPVAEIVAMNYSLQETHVPIYGYASYTFDTIAKGQRLVTGTLRVNFLEEWYLKSILTKLSEEKVNSSNPKSPLDYNAGHSPLTKDELMRVINRQDSDEIKATSEKYEDYIWGKDKGWTINKYENTYFTDKDSALTNKGFDIIIPWGNELFQIAGITPDMTELPGTVTVINGVRLTGVAKVIEPTGGSVYEEYTFIARDLNNSLISEEEIKQKAISEYAEQQKALEDQLYQQLKDERSIINEIIWLKSEYENKKYYAEEAVTLWYDKLEKIDKPTSDLLHKLNYGKSVEWYKQWLYKNNLPPMNYIKTGATVDYNEVRRIANEIIYLKKVWKDGTPAQKEEIEADKDGVIAGYYKQLKALNEDAFNSLKNKNYDEAKEWYDYWLNKYELMPQGYEFHI